jgi:hypothetical protein
LNTLRLWGIGVSLPDALYGLADELGIMISQEFPLANCLPESDPIFVKNLKATCTDLVKQLRNHPSIRSYSAVYGIIGFVDVPIVWMSIRWWRTIHPRVLSAEKIDLDPRMWYAVLFCFATMLVLYTILMRARIRLEKMRETVYLLQEKTQEA